MSKYRPPAQTFANDNISPIDSSERSLRSGHFLTETYMHRSLLSVQRKSQIFPTLGCIGVNALRNRCSLLRRYFSCEKTDFLSKFTLLAVIVEIMSYGQSVPKNGQ